MITSALHLRFQDLEREAEPITYIRIPVPHLIVLWVYLNFLNLNVFICKTCVIHTFQIVLEIEDYSGNIHIYYITYLLDIYTHIYNRYGYNIFLQSQLLSLYLYITPQVNFKRRLVFDI